LIPPHRYLFKNAEGWQAGQLWTEVFAWQFSLLLGIDVPRCFVGVDGRGVPGAVIEFFFGYPGEPAPERFFHASDLDDATLSVLGIGGVAIDENSVHRAEVPSSEAGQVF
jgi:hypothetical protein